MPRKTTFGQYVIEHTLPFGMLVTKTVDKREMDRMLNEVKDKHPEKYARVVTDLKTVGDRFALYEGLTMGMDEIAVPNKVERNKILKDYTYKFENAKTTDIRMQTLEDLQDALVKNDTKGMTDSATIMVESGGLGSKRNQLVKLRTTPAVVKDHQGNLVEDIINKSYAEGLDVAHHWLGSVEARSNLVQGQVSTSKPGEFNKVLNNVLGDAVVSTDECGTTLGILLNTRDEDVLDRYLAQAIGKLPAGTLVTSEIQQRLLKQGKYQILVRSPQTCEAVDNTVCAMCMGLAIDSGTRYTIGQNAGSITAGSLSEPLVQLVLSAKHSTTLAKREEGLRGESGFRTFVEMPESYPQRQIYSEVYGKIYKIIPAPQGGKFITIRETKRVPDRYIVHAVPDKNLKRHWVYYIPPQRKFRKNIVKGADVHPGMELTDGVKHLKDISRLRGIGVARSESAQGMSDIYKNTGQHIDRRHFELLARATNNYAKLEKSPIGFGYRRGEIVNFNKLRGELAKLPSQNVAVSQSLGMTLMENIHSLTIGTDITPEVVNYLKEQKINNIKASRDVSISPVTVPMTRSVNLSDSTFLSKLNHRFLKTTLAESAQYGQSESLHGYNPILPYVMGSELTSDDPTGRY